MRVGLNAIFCFIAASKAQESIRGLNCTTTLAIGPVPTASANVSVEASPQLLRDLLSAPTSIERARRLLVDGESLRKGDDLRNRIVFDFNNAQSAIGALGGAAKTADITTFPFSIGLDLSMSMLFLEPCGINTPHIHPRAAEILVLVEGSNLKFGTILEDGLVMSLEDQEVASSLGKFQATAFPQGSLHYQFNDSCEKAVVVAVLNSGNPGTNRIAQNFLSLNKSVLNATLGFPSSINGKSIEELRNTLPANLAQDVRTCLARCRKQ